MPSQRGGVNGLLNSSNVFLKFLLPRVSLSLSLLPLSFGFIIASCKILAAAHNTMLFIDKSDKKHRVSFVTSRLVLPVMEERVDAMDAVVHHDAIVLKVTEPVQRDVVHIKLVPRTLEGAVCEQL